MQEHMEGLGKIRFMGSHDLELFADFNWNEDKTEATISGYARMKMLKWLTYQFSDSSSGRREESGVLRCFTGLKSQFGNGELKASIEVNPDNTLKGKVDIIKGISLPFEGKRVL